MFQEGNQDQGMGETLLFLIMNLPLDCIINILEHQALEESQHKIPPIIKPVNCI